MKVFDQNIIIIIASFSFQKIDNQYLEKKDEGERLSRSLESMGTTFIKLGQFLATRPDIISEDLSKHLEKLQDKLRKLCEQGYCAITND